MKTTFLFVCIFSIQITSAQDDWRVYDGQTNDDVEELQLLENENSIEENTVEIDTLQEGRVQVNSDPRIDSLVTTLDDNPPAVKGYRVEIFFGQRKDAEKVKSAFLKHYSDWPIYVVWQQPNFKVQIGDFMTKLQAEKAQQEIKSNYPNSYITITQIKISEN